MTAQHSSKLRFILFDWGDTLMVDNPQSKLPMAEWPRVEAVHGAADCLRRIKDGRLLALATGAEVSTEAEIRRALGRVGLSDLLDAVFCFKNSGLQKPELAFYEHILEKLNARPDETAMIGDNFEKDVLAANQAGMRAVWFNPRSSEVKEGQLYRTIHHLIELPALLEKEW